MEQFHSEHMRGWVEAMLRRWPPAICDKEYVEGYKAGLRHRLMDARNTLARLPHIEMEPRNAY